MTQTLSTTGILKLELKPAAIPHVDAANIRLRTWQDSDDLSEGTHAFTIQGGGAFILKEGHIVCGRLLAMVERFTTHLAVSVDTDHLAVATNMDVVVWVWVEHAWRQAMLRFPKVEDFKVASLEWADGALRLRDDLGHVYIYTVHIGWRTGNPYLRMKSAS